ncbi:sigma-70 family RNA polymerase sigma factor [Candidatus Phytoplasma australasiaticum]|uniref:Sigma-70 family RNA polymerase sigma factor n=2 Tax=16SrII (Peanut WB group) TaxID=85621 RepID=A0AAP4X8L1_9MOLU|nr:sigma-70 family RNA polymerase sigma factor [Candidatus Phytoplasma australasiaticum]MDO8054651.1 sigma-70 family RNA polymerase sigma factor [Candidatus Phytoplasma australasiaticum]MDO8058988.1 sigma-70 family RNA polymerase sigma factor [Candidatus Phytoplasma australasiaticum]
MNRKTLFLLFLKDKSNFKLREQLIILHLPLVKKLVYQFKYYPRCLTRADLEQEGILGLMKALDNYIDLGCDFLAYAKPHIQKAISEAIRKMTKSITLVSCWVDHYHYPLTSPLLTPHQHWLKQGHHELFLKTMKKKLSANEFSIIHLSFGIPLGNIHENYQSCYTNTEIAEQLNLTLRQVVNIKEKAIKKLKKIYRKSDK